MRACVHTFVLTCRVVVGMWQEKLCKALEKAPPKTYLEAMAALLKWIEGVELLLESEPFQVTDTSTMEEQGLHYRVGNITLHYRVGNITLHYRACTTGWVTLPYTTGWVTLPYTTGLVLQGG